MTTEQTWSIWERLQELAATQPDTPAVIGTDLQLSFDKLFRLSRSYAARLKAEGIGPGDIVSLASGDTIAAVSSVFALSCIGAVFVPYSQDFLTNGVVSSMITVFLRTPEAPSVPGRREVVIDNSWSPRFAKDDGSKTHFAATGAPNSVTWLLPSSGTTGRTKHIEVTRDLLQRRLGRIAEDYGVSKTRMLQLFHPSTRAFMIRAIAALTSGNSLVEPGPADFIREAGVTLICGSPQQVRLWIADDRISPKIPMLQVSGAKLPAVLVTNLLDSFDVIEDVYGSNETTKSHVNVYSRLSQEVTVFGKTGSGIQIVNPDGSTCQIGTAGYIRVKTDCMAQSYLGDTGASATHFRDGWFYPGDLGFLDVSNVLTVVGRESDLVNIEGDKVLLSEVEECLNAVQGVTASSCFEITDRDGRSRIAACITVFGEPNPVAAARVACVNRFGLVAAPSSILIVPALERTADGVIRRGAARDLYDRIASAEAGTNSHLYEFGDL